MRNNDKRNISEITPPKPRFIERVHNKNNTINEKNLKNTIILKEQHFHDILPDYIYEINFPKESNLLEIHRCAFSSEFYYSHLRSITLPPSLKEINVESFKNCKYLEQITFLKDNNGNANINYIGTRAFRDTVIQTIIIPKEIEKIGFECFPRSLKNIIFENGAPKLIFIGSSIFRETQLETFSMPLNIIPFVLAQNVFYKCKQLKTIVFDQYANGSAAFKSIRNFEKNQKSKRKFQLKKILDLITSPQNTLINYKVYYIPAMDLAKSLLISQTKIEKLEISFSNLNYFYFYNTPLLKSISIAKSDNKRYVKYQGCLYTKNMKKLIVAERNIQSTTISSNCQIIENYALNVKSLEKVVFEKNSKLKEISKLAFSDSQIKEINIPDGVESIEYGAFYHCENLEKANIPRALRVIDYATFSYTNLIEITIPKNIAVINYGCFLKCSKLSKVDFEEGSNLIIIDDYAFAGTNINSISIPQKVVSIGKCCFLYCHNLKSISFAPDSNLSNIGRNCFKGTQIKKIDVPPKIEELNLVDSKVKSVSFSKESILIDSIYLQSSLITRISIPPSVTLISSYAFFDCIHLNKVEIIDIKYSKLECISNSAFCDCCSLVKFDLPKTIKIFKSCCFKNCRKYNVNIILNNDDKIVIEEHAFENSGIKSFTSKSFDIEVRDYAFLDCKNLTQFASNAVFICFLGTSAYMNCCSLTDVEISKNIEYIQICERCFMNSSIKTFNAPCKLNSFPNECFKFCRELITVTIDEESCIEFFGKEAFKESAIQSIFIPNQTKNIGNNCFEKCKELKSLTFSKSINEIILNEAAFKDSGIENLTISKGIKDIQPHCFENCTNLKKVDFSNKIQFNEINESVFEFSGIENIVFPYKINNINTSAFRKCQNLRSITFFADDVMIFPFAFADCYNLNEVKCNSGISIYDLSSDVIKIDQSNIDDAIIKYLLVSTEPAFDDIHVRHFICDSSFFVNEKIHFNTVFNFEDNEYRVVEHINGGYYSNLRKKIFSCDFSCHSLTVLNETEVIKKDAFKFTNLRKVYFENCSQLKKIKSCAFENLQIEEITIPDSVTLICDSAFKDCHSLKKVNINPTSKLGTIGKSAFEKTAIKTITFPSKLKTIGEYAFYECLNLKHVDNFSNKINFGCNSFSKSSIEKINFPSNSIFSVSSFKECLNLKHLKFLSKPKKLTFEEESFAFSGLEEIILDSNVIIQDNAFIFCHNLEKVSLKGNVQLYVSPFSNCNIKSLILKIRNISCVFYWESLDHFSSLIHKIAQSSIEKCSLSFNIKDENNHSINHKIHLINNCYVLNNTLIYVDMNYIKTETDKENQDEIKSNHILYVPDNVKKLDFQAVTHIKKIEWSPNNIVEDLGPPKFFSYYQLIEITIPKLVETIPSYLFEHCHFLRKVKFENGSKLKEIGEYAFSNTCLEQVNIPKSVKFIGKCSFYNIKTLNEVTYEGEIIGEEAFSQSGLTKFTLSNNTQKICCGAFQYCHSLTTFNIDIIKSLLNEIEEFAFSETSITSINIPNELKKINKFTFSDCKSLKVVNISMKSKLEEICDYAFSCNLSLLTINIPPTIRNISTFAFINTPLLQSIMRESNEKYHLMKDNSVYLNDKELLFVPRNLIEIQIKNDCNIIHSGSFCGSKLEKVSFSNDNSLKIIKKCAFAHSKSLKYIKIPKSVIFIGEEAFIDCSNLETVVFESPSQLIEIPTYCFAYSGLKTINIPESIKIINHSSFLFCKNLMDIKLNDTKIEYLGDYAFSETNIKEVVFPPTIKFIASHVFDGDKSLKNIDFTQIIDSKLIIINEISDKKSIKEIKNINNRVLKSIINRHLNNKNNDIEIINENDSICTIHELSFCNTSVNLLKFDMHEYKWYDIFIKFNKRTIKQRKVFPSKYDYYLSFKQNYLFGNVKIDSQENPQFTLFPYDKSCKYIKLSPFDFVNASDLTHVIIDEDIQLKKIPKLCFSKTELKEITLPSTVRTIKKGAFLSCDKLERVNFSDDSQLISIQKYSFYECCKLNEFHFPKNVKFLNEKCFLFTGITSIELPCSVKKIGSHAFANCTKLSHVVLNKGIIEIGDFSFANDTLLKRINLPDTLTTIKEYAFLNCTSLEEAHTSINTKLIKIYDGAFENTQIEQLSVNRCANKLFIPKKVPKLNKITFCKGYPTYFMQFEDGSIYEPNHQFDKLINSIEDINEHEIKTEMKIKQEISNDYFKSALYIYKPFMKEINNPNIRNTSTYNSKQFLLLKNRSIHSQNYHPILHLLFAPKNIEILKIQENCFSMSESILDDMNQLTTIEYMNGITNYVMNFPSYNHLYTGKMNKINKVRILGENSIIEERAFSYFESLQNVDFDESTNILYIPKFSFLDCNNLQKIVIPSSCFSIEEGSFKNCINLKSVEFKSDLKFIKSEAFYNCSALETITIPATVYAISKCAFMNCTKLKKICFETTREIQLKIIEKNAFRNCSSLSSFTLPASCIILGPASFMNCTSLQSFEYNGEKLKSIQCRTFLNCKSLSTIKINHLKYDHETSFTICDESFMNCNSLKEIIIEEEYPEDIDDDEHSFLKLKSIKSKHRDISSEVQKIGARAFSNCISLSFVRLFMRNLKSIHDSAFVNCHQLKAIEINSKYFQSMFSQDTCLSTFVGAPNDIKIKIFDKDGNFQTLTNQANKKINKISKRHIKDNFQSFEKTFSDLFLKDKEEENEKDDFI